MSTHSARLQRLLESLYEQEFSSYNEALAFLLSVLGNLLLEKRREYGHEPISQKGFTTILFNLNRKYLRLNNMEKNGHTIDLTDCLADIAGYSLLGILVLHDFFELKETSGSMILAGDDLVTNEDGTIETPNS